jgi:hypothetical protein
MVLKALVCYAVAFFIPVIAFIFLVKLSKGKVELSALHITVGVLSFFAVLVGMLALMMFAFANTSTVYMTSYMPEWLYKLAVALLFFGAICLARFFIINAAYFSKGREDKGTSFLVGFGIAGGFAISIYCLYSFIYIAVTALNTDFVELTSESLLKFADSTVISVFTPFESHIYIALVFVIYACLMLIESRFMSQHANLPYKWTHTLIMYLLTSFCEVCMLSIILFSVSSISIIAIAVMALVLVILAGLAVKLLYKYKEELPYNNQFN